MNEADIATAGIGAHRVLLAMQTAHDALARHKLDDADALRRLHAPGTELHEAICAHVKHLKSAGLSAEQVVVLAKQSVAQLECVLPSRALTERVILLCIQEYYRDQ